MARGWHALWLACALMLFPALARAKAPTVEVVTVGPGDPLFSRWGHVGLRVQDDGEDQMYAFGYARAGGFAQLVALLRGEAIFRLAIRDWDKALAGYRDEDRQVERQTLRLHPELARELVERLKINARPTNREYVYDSFTDNCSTRVRDLLDTITDGALRRAAEQRTIERTLRDDTRAAAAGRPGLEIGLDLLIGPHQDQVPDAWAAMYRPADLQATLALATRPDGQPLAEPIEVLHAARRQPPSPRSAGTWALWFSIPLAGLLLWSGRRVAPPWLARSSAVVIGLLGLASGIAGLLVLATMIVAVVPSLAINENILVFVPLDLGGLALAARWWRGTAPVGVLEPFGRRYVGVRGTVLVLLLAAKLVGVSHQDNLGLVVAALVVLAAIWFAAPPTLRRT